MGGVLSEFMNLFLCATRSQVDWIITFFVALIMLSQIDQIYLESFCDVPMIEIIEHPLNFKRKPEDIKFNERSWQHKIIYIVWYVMYFSYNSWYYYYLPFLVSFVPYFFAAPNDS